MKTYLIQARKLLKIICNCYQQTQLVDLINSFDADDNFAENFLFTEIMEKILIFAGW